MPVPRRRHCSARQGKDRAHKKLYVTQSNACPSCGVAKMPHRICTSCGHYKGAMVMQEKKD